MQIFILLKIKISATPPRSKFSGLSDPECATGNLDPHRCALDSNDDFLIRNDH